jgi:transposase-like protein
VTERELTRKANWRLAIIRHAQEVTGNVAVTCRYYGVPRQSYYKWLRRYEELGVDGLRDRSCRPLVSPHATKAARPPVQWPRWLTGHDAPVPGV